MKHHTIAGGGWIQRHVVETGNPSGRPILFIHGISQCWLTWSRQLNSELRDRYRLVAMDMRGHGLSEMPRDAYADSQLWADDINAVLQALKLDRPVLCGWSYGPEVCVRCCGCASRGNPRRRICTSRWGLTSRSHHRCARRSSHARSTTMISCRRSRSLC